MHIKVGEVGEEVNAYRSKVRSIGIYGLYGCQTADEPKMDMQISRKVGAALHDCNFGYAKKK